MYYQEEQTYFYSEKQKWEIKAKMRYTVSICRKCICMLATKTETVKEKKKLDPKRHPGFQTLTSRQKWKR